MGMKRYATSRLGRSFPDMARMAHILLAPMLVSPWCRHSFRALTTVKRIPFCLSLNVSAELNHSLGSECCHYYCVAFFVILYLPIMRDIEKKHTIKYTKPTEQRLRLETNLTYRVVGIDSKRLGFFSSIRELTLL